MGMEMNTTERIIFWLLLAMVVGISSHRVHFLVRLIRLGKGTIEFNHLTKRIRSVLIYVLGQWSNIKNISPKDLAGLGHLVIFWGVVLFSINYFIFLFIGEGVGFSIEIRNTILSHYFLYLSEIMGLFLLLAIVSATVRRCIMKPARLGPHFDSGIFFILTLGIFLLFTLYFAQEGLRMNLGTNGFRTPIAGALANLFNWIQLGQENQRTLFKIVWWAQYGLILGMLIYAPYSHHQHPLFAPFNIFFRSFDRIGTIQPINFDKEERFGVSMIKDFTWKQLLDCLACTDCGRCQDGCPASLSGKPLSPKKLIRDLKNCMQDTGHLSHRCPNGGYDNHDNNPIIGKYVKEDEIWSCTTCGNCLEQCPVFIEQMQKIIDMRHSLVMAEANFPEELVSVFKNLEFVGDPLGIGLATRGEWAETIGVKELAEDNDVEWLFYVGCSLSFDERNKRIASAFAKILKSANIKFGILGQEEGCCGDSARRLGNEYLYQTLVHQNIEVFKSYDVKKIVTTCPHCYNTLKNEYPILGGNYEVLHHTQFIANLFARKTINSREYNAGRFVYHDPCYLGRYNNIYEAPRYILLRLSILSRMTQETKILELERSKEKSFCCGAGGGSIWITEENGKRINEVRTDQILELQPDTIVTACPFCMTMISDGVIAKEKDEQVTILDIAELVAQSLD